MKRGILLSIALTIIGSIAYGQEVTLKECWSWAKEYYPKAKDRQVLLENS